VNETVDKYVMNLFRIESYTNLWSRL